MLARSGAGFNVPTYLDSSRRAPDQSQNEQQYHRSDECDEDRAAHSPEWLRNSQGVEQPPADERTDDADYDVTDDPVAGTTHHERSENACYEPHYDPGDYPHCVRPVEEFFAYECGTGGIPAAHRITKKERSDESAPCRSEEPFARLTFCTRTRRRRRWRWFPDN